MSFNNLVPDVTLPEKNIEQKIKLVKIMIVAAYSDKELHETENELLISRIRNMNFPDDILVQMLGLISFPKKSFDIMDIKNFIFRPNSGSSIHRDRIRIE